jgi:hypothetical protein
MLKLYNHLGAEIFNQDSTYTKNIYVIEAQTVKNVVHFN